MEDKKIDEGIYLRKGSLGYRLIYPIKNDDGSINWFNLFCGGSWGNLIKTIFILCAILAMVYSYKVDVATYKNITDYVSQHPCDWCNNLMKLKPELFSNTTVINNSLYNIPILPIKNG